MTVKSFHRFALALLAAFSIGATASADDAIEITQAKYIGDQTGGAVTASGKAGKTLIQQGAVVTAKVKYVVQQVVMDATNTEVTKTQNLELCVPVLVTPRLNPKKMLLGFNLAMQSDPIFPIPLVAAGETAVSDPVISRVNLVVTLTKTPLVVNKTRELFELMNLMTTMTTTIIDQRL